MNTNEITHPAPDLTATESAELLTPFGTDIQLRLMTDEVNRLLAEQRHLAEMLGCEPNAASIRQMTRMLMRNSWVHVIPDEVAIEANRSKEPEGERLRSELAEWIDRNGIVGIFLDTERHVIDVSSARLPSNIKPVLTLWGSIYVRDEERIAEEEARDANL